MSIVLVILGGLAGGSLSGFSGAFFGGGIGYIIATLITMHKRLRDLEGTVNALRYRQEQQEQPGVNTAALSSHPDAASATEGSHAGEPVETFTFEEEPAEPAGTGWEEAEKRAKVWRPEVQPVPPKTPLFLQNIADSLNSFFTGGSLLVKTGVVILFFGVSFLVKYAADHALFPIEMRLSAAAIGGIALLAIGWRLRLRREHYSQILQGGGVGILYLTTFAALRLYALIPPSFAFAILVAIALLSSVLAVLQNARALAVLGVSGGFLAPILASTGGGNHVTLFSYYALLNAGIIGIAWFRAWRILNLLGFAFTFGIGSFWGYRYYQPDFFATTEPFLILFFLIYVAIAVLFALRQEPELRGYLDGTLVFGTPVVAFTLQAMLVRPFEYGLAWSALALGLLYIPLAWVLYLQRPRYMRTLIEAFFAFGVVFGTLAIPLALENRWTSAAWALEGAGILWAGLRQNRRLARCFGMLLLFGAGLAFLGDIHRAADAIPVFNVVYLGSVLLAVTGLFAALCLYRRREKIESWELPVGIALFTWGLLWWFGGGLLEIDRQLPDDLRMGGVLLFLAVSCVGCAFLERRRNWPWLTYPALSLLPTLFITAVMAADSGLHPFAEAGFLAWPVALAGYYLILYRREATAGAILPYLHAGIAWLVTGLCAWEFSWQVDHWIAGSETWPLIAWGVIPAVAVLVVATAGRNIPWPVARHFKTYLTIGAGPLAVAAWLWAMYVNITSPGDTAPLPYLPIVNPLDLGLGFTFIVLLLWFRQLRISVPDTISPHLTKQVFGLYAASIFAWFNAILVRTIHQWGGVSFTASALFDSLLLQASLSIFWSLLALCTMVTATRRGLHFAWLTGAGLLAAVVIKLFMVDLSNSGTVERIVSFVGVGILLLVIGYFSPVPPRKKEETDL
jgi:uncharacterized membrane protein